MTNKNYKDFLNGWSDNKVRALLFDDRTTSSLRFIAAAFAHRNRIACASINTARWVIVPHPTVIKMPIPSRVRKISHSGIEHVCLLQFWWVGRHEAIPSAAWGGNSAHIQGRFGNPVSNDLGELITAKAGSKLKIHVRVNHSIFLT